MIFIGLIICQRWR